MSFADLQDPRTWPAAGAATAAGAALHRAVIAAIEAPTGDEADARNAEATHTMAAWMAACSAELAGAFATAPSHAVVRHLRRLLALLERGDPEHSTRLRTTLIALPVVLVAALDAREGELTLPGLLSDTRALEAMLGDAHEFGGAQHFALAPTLAAADAIDIAALPGLVARRDLDSGSDRLPPLDFAPAPIVVQAACERVHLRFIAAAVLTAPGADPMQATSIAHWGMPVAQALSRQLGAAGLSLLALPRPPARLVPAVQTGRAVQREVSAQVFASNAIRKFRASVGEPTAIMSAHRAADAPGGGELRLSLSSPFAVRDAEGFRCPLEPYESVEDVGAMLAGMLRDCRVADVRVHPGVHADIDPLTGTRLLFKDAGTEARRPLH